MTDLHLTAERRSELLDLLDNPTLLRSIHPTVSEYLETAPQLAGTGNIKTDAAFELRFMHFMTSEMHENPYWDIISPFISWRNGSRKIDGGNPQGSPRLAFAQMILQGAFAYAVPSPDTLEWIAEHAHARSVIEAGAGRGYWAKQLSLIGLKVKAFDVAPPMTIENPSFPSKWGSKAWHEVHYAQRLKELTQDNAEKLLLLCWPPGWESPMASETLRDFEDTGGSRLIYIGEPKGGKNADNAFFSALSDRWKLEDENSRYVTWWNLNDQAQIWVRKR